MVGTVTQYTKIHANNSIIVYEKITKFYKSGITRL